MQTFSGFLKLVQVTKLFRTLMLKRFKTILKEKRIKKVVFELQFDLLSFQIENNVENFLKSFFKRRINYSDELILFLVFRIIMTRKHFLVINLKVENLNLKYFLTQT